MLKGHMTSIHNFLDNPPYLIIIKIIYGEAPTCGKGMSVHTVHMYVLTEG